ncbi:uncharacterized protein LOC113232509 [Hyposmocoma kahamanoa]|uniref:uncharacterized protein LOC113232509 n=1 Tax=Hyposmocoma kahamanoa TaxID=1477025 RepID=UPI000E6D88C0|nr:uncharacterized protein LOC113232509 [Hyposmocoma kahamanoa]
MHPNSKDYNVSPPYISSEGSSILIFLRCKADNDVEAYTQELCQLSSSKTPSTPSGDCSTSRKRDDQITPSEQIYSSSPTAEFASKPKSGRLSSQIDLRVSLVTPERKCYFFDICKHLTSTTIPSQEDVQKIMTEKNNRYKSICKSQCHIEPTNKNRIHSKLSLEEYCKKCTTRTTSDSCEHRPQPWISQHFFGLQPKYQSNPTVANTCWYTKEREDFNSQNPLKLEHFKPPFVPELPEPQNTYKDCTCNQYLSRPVSQFSSKPPCPTKITPCPDPLKRCPTINSSNPRYNHLPISKEDFCQSIPRSQNYLQFHNRESKYEPGMVTPPPRNYNSPVTNCAETNMTPNKSSKPYKRSVQEMLRPPMNSESQTRFNMQKQIDEAKKSKERQHRDFCCPVERGHNQIPYNPCCPVYYKGNYKTFRMIFIYLGFPLILFQMYRIYASGGFSDHHKVMPFCEYEYMRRRTKRFPWGDGNNSLFHNPAVNYLPQDCEANCKRKTECICKQSD